MGGMLDLLHRGKRTMRDKRPFTPSVSQCYYKISFIKVWVHAVNGHVFGRSNKYTF